MTRRLVILFAVLALSACQTVGNMYDSVFGSSVPAEKPSELQAFTATADARILWQANIGPAERFAYAPVAAGSWAFASNAAGDVVKLDLRSGKVQWRASTGLPVSTGPGTDGRLVVVGTARGQVVAIDEAGQLLWKTQVSGEILSTPEVAEGIVVVKSGDGRIFGLSLLDGRRRWVYQRSLPALTLRSASGVTALHGGVFAGFPGGKLVALVLGTGALGWEGTVSSPRGSTELERVTDIVGAPLVDDRIVCAVAYQGKAGCFDALKGTQLWARELSGIMPVGGDGRNVYITDDEGHVHAFGKGTGASIWKMDKLKGRGVTGAAVLGSFVGVGDYQGYVHFLRRTDGAMAVRIATDGSAILRPPVSTGESVLVQTRNGGLFNIIVR